MTNEEEKILEEENDITLEDAAEEAEELQEETQDEVKEVREEISEDVRLDPDEIRERPVLRDGGLRDAGHPEMIQTHIDNFLAMIAGATPADSNVRNSHEFWLNEIYTKYGHLAGKHLYKHTISAYHGTNKSAVTFVLFTESDTAITSIDSLVAVISAMPGAPLISTSGAIYYASKWWLTYVIRKSATYFEFFGIDIDTPDGYVAYAALADISTILTACNDYVEQLF